MGFEYFLTGQRTEPITLLLTRLHWVIIKMLASEQVVRDLII